MEVRNHHEASVVTAEPTVKCAFCKDAMPRAQAMRSQGVCRLCASEIEEFGWRTVYDRELNLGQIPANLRAAYKL
jgi:hypothetical protein